MAPAIDSPQQSSGAGNVPRGVERGLFISYLLVFTALLVAFVLTIHFSFVSTLNSRVSARLETLLAAGRRSLHVSHNGFALRQSFSETALLAAGEGIQWFDAGGKVVADQGLVPVPEPLTRTSTEEREIQLSRSHTVRVRVAAIVNPAGGRTVGWIRAVQDVTQLKLNVWRLDEILIIGGVCAIVLSVWGARFLQVRSVQPIRASYERLQEFSANASHELRGPITAIRSNADAALRDDEGMRPRDFERFSSISHAAKQLTVLTEDMLLLARAEQPMEHDVFLIDLSTLLNDVIAVYRAEIEASGVTLSKRMPPGITLYGNPDQLHRIFANLVLNAIKYTPRGGRVEVEGSQQRGGAVVRVRDSGIGIAEDQIGKLFDRFWRAEAARTRSTGTGLGLPIARALARRHGGDITVSSIVGKGSDFTVTLPSHPPS